MLIIIISCATLSILSSDPFVYIYKSQDHYDWGLRAIKSVLVVAGSLKRGDPERPEDQVLMRALRDFNVPKIVTDDMPVFMGLIGDLFPALDVPRKRDMDFEKFVKQSILDLKLQAEDNFVLKVREPVHHLSLGCVGEHSNFIFHMATSNIDDCLQVLHFPPTFLNHATRVPVINCPKV